MEMADERLSFVVASHFRRFLGFVAKIRPSSRTKARAVLEAHELSRHRKELLNRHQSRLWQLPDELLLAIAAELPPVQALCMSMTCRRLYQTLDIVIKEPRWLKRSSGPFFQACLARDEYHRQCDAEAQGVLSKVRACSACCRIHKIPAFSDHAPAAQAVERVCRNAERRIVFCEHRSVTFAELRAMLDILNRKSFMSFIYHE